MGRKSITSGVRPKGEDRIEFDFEFDGKRYRPTVRRPPTEGNLRRALQQLEGIRERITNGTFSFAEEFPDFRFVAKVDSSARAGARTCNEVFDDFLQSGDMRRTVMSWLT